MQDPTEVNWTTLRTAQGLGPLGNTAGQGLFVQSTWAITPDRIPLGRLAQHVWARAPNDVGQRARRQQVPMTQKESQQWLHRLDAVCTAREWGPPTGWVRVGDREADVYDVLAAERPAGVEWWIRAAWDRGVSAPQRPGWATVEAQPVCRDLVVHVPRRDTPPAREARVSLRSGPLTW